MSSIGYLLCSAPFKPCSYRESDYVVAIFAAQDFEKVAKVNKYLYEKYININYDDGIPYDNHYDGIMTRAIDNSKLVLAFTTEAAVNDERFKKYISYAGHAGKTIINYETIEHKKIPSSISAALSTHVIDGNQPGAEASAESLIKSFIKGITGTRKAKSYTTHIGYDSESDDSGKFRCQNCDDGIILTGYTGSDSAVPIPEKIGGKTVVELRGTFEYNREIVSVTIPSTVKRISDGTFKHCPSLEGVLIEEGIDEETNHDYYIGSDAFLDCGRLTRIVIPKRFGGIDENAFKNCSKLKSVTLLSDCAEIDKNAFSGCYELIDFIAPNIKIADVKQLLFMGCKKLTITCEDKSSLYNYSVNKHINVKTMKFDSNDVDDLPKSEECVINESQGFEYIIKDKRAIITKYIGKDISVLNIPSRLGGKKVSKISSCAFEGNSSIREVTIPSDVTVGCNAFYNCKKLNTVKAKSGVKIEGDNAFTYCDPDLKLVHWRKKSDIAKFAKAHNIEFKRMA